MAHQHPYQFLFVLLFANVIGLFSSVRVFAQPLLIKDVFVINTDHTINRRSVLIEDGFISKIAPTAQLKGFAGGKIIDGSGRYLIPGLIDSHVHLDGVPGMLAHHLAKYPNLAEIARKQIPKSYLYFGFTTVIDLFSGDEAISAWNDQIIRPDAYHCAGVPIFNGYPLAWLPKASRHKGFAANYVLYDERQASLIPRHIKSKDHSPERIVARIKQTEAICVKAFYERGFGLLTGLPVPTDKMLSELKVHAQQAGLPVLLHGNSQASHQVGLNAGIDIFAHGMWHLREPKSNESRDGIQALLDRIVESGTGYQATAQVLIGEREMFNRQFFDLEAVKRAIPNALAAWYKSDEGQWMRHKLTKSISPSDTRPQYETATSVYAGVINGLESVVSYLAGKDANILFGSDTPSGPIYTQFPGVNAHLEMRNLLNAGLTLPQLYDALTISNARAFKLEHLIGSVERGKKANLLLLNKNPLTTISAYESIDLLILNGALIDRASLSAQ